MSQNNGNQDDKTNNMSQKILKKIQNLNVNIYYYKRYILFKFRNKI